MKLRSGNRYLKKKESYDALLFKCSTTLDTHFTSWPIPMI